MPHIVHTTRQTTESYSISFPRTPVSVAFWALLFSRRLRAQDDAEHSHFFNLHASFILHFCHLLAFSNLSIYTEHLHMQSHYAAPCTLLTSNRCSLILFTAFRFKTSTEEVRVCRFCRTGAMGAVLFIPVCTLPTPTNRKRGAGIPNFNCSNFIILPQSFVSAKHVVTANLVQIFVQNMRITSTRGATQHNSLPCALFLRLPVPHQCTAFQICHIGHSF